MNKKLSIALDSNVFRNHKFIDYLILNKNNLDIALPKIVQLEIGFFYRLNGFSWNEFTLEMSKMNCSFMKWEMGLADEIIEIIFKNKKILPFKEHIRDYLIGFQCVQEARILITYNIAHFAWITKIKPSTPEDFVFNLHKSRL